MQNKVARAVLALIVAVAVFVVINAAGILIFSYSPKDVEQISLAGQAQSKKLSPDKIKILTFNTGYGALGEEADSKKEGGKGKRQSADAVLKNIRGISEIVNLSSADIMLLQGVDVDSYRSRYVDEYDYYLNNGSYIGAFAKDHSARSTSLLPPYKKVTSGLLTLSRKNMLLAERISLPKGYGGLSAPTNPKRAMLVSLFDVEGSDKKLAVINLELDAYTNKANYDKQLSAAVNFAKKLYENGYYVVCAGGFNAQLDDTSSRYPLNDRNAFTPKTFNSSKLESGWLLSYDPSVATARILNAPYDAKAPYEERQVYVSDGFITSPNVEIKNVVTVDQQFRYSHHNPVLLEISLK
ncbi:MAG: endonuclease/exonuclease/phosphatase family protein [Oscillospiraceae bacterium]|nr:endonuclease/exonuclease/phosphatase family protein [Oscillospiraceae bacterium]